MHRLGGRFPGKIRQVGHLALDLHVFERRLLFGKSAQRRFVSFVRGQP